MDLVKLRDYDSPDGANVQIAVEDSSGRIVLIATELLIPATGASLTALEKEGWLINIDPQEKDSLAWRPGSVVRSTNTFGGTSRVAYWDLPIVKRTLRLFGGRAVTELNRINR
jgi:hypothetical protein